MRGTSRYYALITDTINYQSWAPANISPLIANPPTSLVIPLIADSNDEDRFLLTGKKKQK